MKVLFLTHAFNSLAQRLFVALRAAGHEVSIEFDVNDRVTEESVDLYRPDLIVAPFLKRAIPATVWQRKRCLIVHPGILGDRGPSALDWAIMNGEERWGVTVLQATGEMDAGPVWASVEFPMREATKSSLYRNEVTEAAVDAVLLALERIAAGGAPLAPGRAGAWHGIARPLLRQDVRAIDWTADDTAGVLRKLHAADGFPGVRDVVAGVPCFLHGGHREGALNADGNAVPGTLLATREGAVCRATRDGALWITHVRRADAADAIKLPAALVLGDALGDVPEVPLAPEAPCAAPTWRDIAYEEHGAVGYLHFPFHNGAMSTRQCERLRAAYANACARPTRVIVLCGGPDFWSNGIHLNLIEADPHPAEASWRNINAMDDLVRDIVCTTTHLTVAALRGNAGAGGAFLALAADRVYARTGVVLNPHYKGMGNLFGSEYWTYLLPRRVADADARRAIVANRLPVAAPEAVRLGLLDGHHGHSVGEFDAWLGDAVQRLAADEGFAAALAVKAARRMADEAAKPLAAYRDEELAMMHLNFFGFDPSYHVARFNFVAKVPRSRTPLHLALHRRLQAGLGSAQARVVA